MMPPAMQPGDAPTIWTIGHSTRSEEELVSLLRGAGTRGDDGDGGIEVLADVRRFPGSRRMPRFGADALRATLRRAGIGYEHVPELGGRRKPVEGSRNTAWRNEAFRGYADYTQTPAFAAGLDRLMALARAQRAAMMCAEAVWWRCHRGLIADALKIRGWRVLHIMEDGKIVEHRYTSAARIVDGRLSYEATEREGTLWDR